MKYLFSLPLLLIAFFTQAQVSFTAGGLKIGIDKKGFVTELSNINDQQNYLSKDTIAPLMTLISDGKNQYPTAMTYTAGTRKVNLIFDAAGVTISVKVAVKSDHIVFEVTDATPANKIDAIIWGPFPTTISKTVGEVIGVVRDDNVAIGLQVLNIKTLGGDLPNNEGSTWKRGLCATTRQWGSTLQAYSINRDRPRNVDAWGGDFANMPVAAMPGESVKGSSIALFSCSASKTLDIIGQIEVAEHLPHPMINGTWFKKSAIFGRSYMISSFSEADVDEMIGYAKRAGMFSLYHEGPFSSWGHYILNVDQFPHGIAGLKTCVEKAHAAGLLLGVHTLSNFINTNDPYVTPVPNEHLSLTGSSLLVDNTDEKQEDIEVSSPEYLKETKHNSLHTVKIGTELIRYNKVSDTLPYKLLNCLRGAYGTRPSPHRKGDTVGKLFDHPYEVFFPDIQLQREIAGNLAGVLNETGVDQLDFDGFEGELASGQGDYALELFAKDVYDHVNHPIVLGTSISKTYFWHICSYYNWGEPWYGGFTESMQKYRIDNQGLFERNFMPHMLGWYLLGENTTMEEMEWMLARAAGYNAGFAMVASPLALRQNKHTGELLDAIREWEDARSQHAFTKAQMEKLKDTQNEFHLEKTGKNQWHLNRYALSPVFTKEKTVKQPGEPTYSTWSFHQAWDAQPLNFKLYAKGKTGSLSNIKITADNYDDVDLPITVSAGETVSYNGRDSLTVSDSKGALKAKYKLKSKIQQLKAGDHTIRFDCTFEGDEPPSVEIRFKGFMESEVVTLNK